MMPEREENSSVLSPGNYQVVAWDLDTTGRRLIDEICQIAGHFSSTAAQSERSFSQYVMPHRNPNPGARRSFGIKVKLLRGQCPALPSAVLYSLFLYCCSQQGGNTIRTTLSGQFNDLSSSLQVVNIGRYRMLKDTTTGKILKTKSEVSALQDFIAWLEVAKGEKDGVILICHEHERKVGTDFV